MSNKAILGLAAAAGFLAASAAYAADASTGAAVSAPADVATYSAALNVPGEVAAAVSGTTVTLSWASVTGATSYQAQYDEKQPDLNDVNSAYAYVADFAASAGATATGEIANLKPSTKYYLIVSAFDAQGRESDVPSKEVSFTTAAPAAVQAPVSVSGAAFGLAGSAVTTVDASTLRLAFNADLDAAKDVTVSVVSNLDKSDLGAVAVADPTDAKSVIVTLVTPMVQDSSYVLTVKSATDSSARSIPAGTDAVREFTFSVAAAFSGSAASSSVAAVAEFPAAEIPAAALNAAPEVTAAVATSGNLPETGPAETVVVLMALALAGAYAMLRRSRA